MLKRSFHYVARAQSAPFPVGLVAAGVALIASTYGMARFGVGLMHPQMVQARPGLDGALRAAGTAQFASYCLAVLVGGRLAATRPRGVVVAAGLSAGVGALGLVLAHSVPAFTAAAFLAGAGAGLASPALVPLLDRAVPTRQAGLSQAAVNSGTALGLLAMGAVVLLTAAVVTPWLLVAAVCAGAGLTVRVLAGPSGPAGRRRGDAGDVGDAGETGEVAVPVGGAVVVGHQRMVLPWVLAALTGAVSAYVWTYGPSVVVRATGLGTDRIGWLWVTVGAGGLLGVLTSRLVDLTSPLRAVLLTAGAVVAATGAVASTTVLGVAVGALALFGAAYMALSGTLILWGRELRPQDGGRATAWLFLALAVGQAVGAALLDP
ncbi:MFS transporter [Serinicoccus sediminis]|uniref:MFS transporter n=1 Tax=Serinicoccus sediminis TaxID=2306021 RepID=UPI0010208380|nr:MFS transporter [Serinicoccus sediminis]